MKKYKTKPPRLKVVDLMRGDNSEHPDINTKSRYLAKIGGEWWAGSFSRVWFGWSFNGWAGHFLQLDKPGTNCSRWEELYEIITK